VSYTRVCLVQRFTVLLGIYTELLDSLATLNELIISSSNLYLKLFRHSAKFLRSIPRLK
jgi:hypothetical protein